MAHAASPWVLVAGGFHDGGGMDRANAALAQYLARSATPIHLVTHDLDPSLAALPGVTAHIVSRPWHSVVLGERRLEQKALAVAARVKAVHAGTRVVVNGGNCAYPDVNWAHCVHAAWPHADRDAPAWFRLKHFVAKDSFRRRERRAFRSARLVIANSDRTRRGLLEQYRLGPERVHTVYLGTDPDWGPPDGAERAAARGELGVESGRRLAVFVGTLDHDQNKGFDTLWRAWLALCRDRDWDVDLFVAGGGRRVPLWRDEVARAGLASRVRLLGFTPRIRVLLAAADVLISPVRYEAYGLNVHEAVCRGVPAIVSARAGVAERYGDDLRDMLLDDPDDAGELAGILARWRRQEDQWRARFVPLAKMLAGWTWSHMAERIVSLAGNASAADRPGQRPRAAVSGAQ